MLTIQAVMLVLAGFLLATLLVLLVVPAYWRRVERLTMDRVRATMPLTETEIRADKDRLRAEYAIKLHRLESEGEKQALAAARQQIELNRRDAVISGLEGEIATMRTALEGYENAHRVLEQTIMERVPSLEHRLSEARKLAFQRDKELTDLRERLSTHEQALAEANVARAHQQDELFKANSVLATLQARGRETLADPAFDAEVALRTEAEGLKRQLSDANRELVAAKRRLAAGEKANAAHRAVANGAAMDAAAGGEADRVDAAEVAALRRALAEAEGAVQAARAEAAAAIPDRTDIDARLRELRATGDDRAVEIARLNAALSAFQGGETSLSLKDSKIAMKARLGALQAERAAHVATIQRMRGELASVNERMARQAQHFMAEMRKLGAAPMASLGATRFGGEHGDAGLGEPAATSGHGARMSGPAAAVARAAEKALDGAPALLKRMSDTELPRVRGFLKALGGAASAVGVTTAEPAGRDGGDRLRERMERIVTVEEDQPDTQPEPGKRARLVERLSNATKS